MDSFFKYVNPGQEDKEWGLSLNCVGKAIIEPGVVYPPAAHPSGYCFNYQLGRVLNEYQINYITEGEGNYENHTGNYKIRPGSILITKPGDWHRYRPRKSTGWVEHYIGFSGSIAGQLFEKPLLSHRAAVFYVGNREEIIDTYYRIFDYVIEEKPGYQQVSAGMVMKLLGFIVSLDKQKVFTGKRIEKIIQNSCFMIRENIDSDIDLKSFADRNNIGYSYFRKMFKKYTGVPPVQYHLDLKMLRAREMLLYTDKSIKEISFELGFQSSYYFSRMFRIKQGTSPSGFRKSLKV